MRYPTVTNEALGNIAVVNPTVTEQLQMRRDALAAELAAIDLALDALKENPKMQQVLDTVSKVMRY